MEISDHGDSQSDTKLVAQSANSPNSNGILVVPCSGPVRFITRDTQEVGVLQVKQDDFSQHVFSEFKVKDPFISKS